uniref:Uncharacterized protein n=1 Tax=Anguilla anguilla TaxID=7936 RepID=A0A0E9Q590_ANGAN
MPCLRAETVRPVFPVLLIF